jgi:hypothetical protein
MRATNLLVGVRPSDRAGVAHYTRRLTADGGRL